MYRKLQSVDGWLARSDYEIFRALLEHQSVDGPQGTLVEIGTHHGKSLIPMVQHGGTDKAYVIDIFENQDKNLDGSGHGDLEKLKANLKKFRVDQERLVFDARPSNEVSPETILSSVGPARFFHIDGGHHLEAIQADIALADKTVVDEGVIAIDDVFRPEWPEVSIGVFQAEPIRDGRWQAFAIGFNKTYFCRADHMERYQAALLADGYLALLLQKEYQVSGSKILVFQRYPSPHWSMRRQILWWTEVYWPSAFPVLKRGEKTLVSAVKGR